MDLSIIIINYKTIEITLSAIESINRYTKDIEYEIIVLDNASGEAESEKLSKKLEQLSKNIIFIKGYKNIGFGKGNNLAVSKSKGKYIVFFNSDCELTGNTFKESLEHMEANKSVGAVGPRLTTPDGKLDSGCRRGFPTPSASFYYLIGMHKISTNPKFDKYKLFHADEFEQAKVDAISGAFFFTSREIFEQAGKFDKNYFMYGEDLDLCHSIKKLGKTIIYNPHLGNVIHHRGESGKHRKIKTLYNFYEAMILFYNKHYRTKRNFIVTILVYIGVGFLFIIKSTASIFKKKEK